MKHASAASLDRLTAVLAVIGGMPGVVERKPGIFYRRGAAFLHFHEDAAGLFADVKLDGNVFSRFEVTSPEQQACLIDAVHRVAASWHHE